MPDGAQVGSAYIEITPEISRPGLAKAQREIKSHLARIAKEVDREFSRQQRDLVGGFNKQMKAMQQGKTSGVFAEMRAEMTSYQKLQKQLAQADRDRMRAFDLEKKKISDSISAQKALQKQKEDALAAEKRAQDKQLSDLNTWYTKKQALEKADRAEAAKAAKQAQDDMDKAFKYRTMRALGASPERAAAYATGQSPAKLAAEFPKLSAAARSSSASVGKSLEVMSHHLSQLSTRIGLASFQLQLLGGFATTFLTAPALMGMARLTSWGYQFAVATDQATASLKAMLPKGYDVYALVERLQKLAIASPAFNADDVVVFTSKLIGAGMEVKKTERLMAALSNIFATFGVSGDSAKLALIGIAQVQQKGRAYSEELGQQIGEQIPIWKLLSDAMGVSQKRLREMVKAGEVDANTFTSALIKIGESKTYLEGASNSVSTLGGVWQQFKEEFRTDLGNAFLRNKDQIIEAINGIRPVVKSFIDWFITAIPRALEWLNKTIAQIQRVKAAYDDLSPMQQDIIKQLVLITLASGPAAIAVGIFGTALSAVANFASLTMKSLSLIGGAATAVAAWATLAGAALIVAAGGMAYLYNTSEPFRKAFLQVGNLLKDFVQTIVLPSVDLLVGAVRSLGRSFSDLGVKAEWLAYVAGILIIPLSMITIGIWALWAAVKIVQGGILVLAATLYGLLHTVSAVLWVVQKLAEGLSLLPWMSDDNKRRLEAFVSGLDGARQGMEGFVDVGEKWKNLTTTGSDATSELQKKLAETDLTTTGLIGAFKGWNSATDAAIQKQVTLEDAINNARNAMQGQASAARSAQDASDQWNKSLLALKDSVDTNKRSLNEKTKAGQANRDMLKQAAGASYEMMLQDIRSGVPMNEAIKRHKARTEQLKKEFGKSKETQAAAQKLIDTYGKVPEDVQTLLKMMGYKDIAGKMQEILAAQKVAANPSLRYADALRVERKAWDKAGKWATGGYIANGPGTTTSDDIFAKLSKKEFVVNARATKDVGPDTLAYINKYGELPLPAFAKGGPVGWPMNVDVSKTKFPEMLGGSASGGGVGWIKMMEILRRQFPGLSLISGFRPGAITSTGNKSYHGMGRAVDLPPRWDVFNWIAQNYGRATKELFFTPAGGRQIINGQLRAPQGGTIAQDHYDHVHWAYDNGGHIAPNTPFINKTGANELALNAAQGKALENKIANSDRPISISVYVDGVRRDAEVVVDEKFDELIQALGGA